MTQHTPCSFYQLALYNKKKTPVVAEGSLNRSKYKRQRSSEICGCSWSAGVMLRSSLQQPEGCQDVRWQEYILCLLLVYTLKDVCLSWLFDLIWLGLKCVLLHKAYTVSHTWQNTTLSQTTKHYKRVYEHYSRSMLWMMFPKSPQQRGLVRYYMAKIHNGQKDNQSLNGKLQHTFKNILRNNWPFKVDFE